MEPEGSSAEYNSEKYMHIFNDPKCELPFSCARASLRTAKAKFHKKIVLVKGWYFLNFCGLASVFCRWPWFCGCS